jgi:heme oxygenase
MSMPAIRNEVSGSMLAQLRHATAARHAALDGASFILHATTITRAQYGSFLHSMRDVVSPLEERIYAIADFQRLLPDAQLRRRASLLTSDLAAIGAADVPPDNAPAAHELPAIDKLSQAFGCGYVLEGSSLGGAVLARTLGPLLSLSPHSGMRYWTAYGDQVGPMWLRFVAALESWASKVSLSEREVVTQTACATFDTFIHHLTARNAAAADGAS